MSLVLLKRLSIALGALVVAWIGVEVLRAKPGDGTEDFPVADVATAAVDSVRVERSTDTVTLRKTGDSAWTVNGLAAAFTDVTDLLAALGEGFPARLVARNPSSHGRFDLDGAAARRLTAFVEDAVDVDLLVGKRGPSFQNVYLRLPEGHEVYLVRSRLAAFADRRADDWRDKTIAQLEPDRVARVVVSRAGGRYTLERGEGGTWLLDGQAADSAAAERLVSQFRSLNAVGFPTEAQLDSVDLDRPDRRVVLSDAAAETLAAFVFDSAATGYWVRRDGLETVFRLDVFRVNQLAPADSTLRASSENP